MNMLRGRRDSSLAGIEHGSHNSSASLATAVAHSRSATGRSFSFSTSVSGGIDRQSAVGDSEFALEEPPRGRYLQAIEQYDACAANKFKSTAVAAKSKGLAFSTAVNDLCGKGAAKSPKDMLLRLRELCVRIGDGALLNGLFFAGLVRLLRELRDKDWDRKCVRYIHFYLRVMVAAEGDVEGRLGGGGAGGPHWRGRGITMRRLADAVTAVEAEARHAFMPRRVVAYQTLAILCAAAGRWREGIGSSSSSGAIESPLPPADDAAAAAVADSSSSTGAGSPSSEEGNLAARVQEMLRGSLSKPLEDYHRALLAAAAGVEGSSGSGTGRFMKRSRTADAEQKDQLLLSRSLFSAVLRSPSLQKDAALLPQVLEGCRCENAVTARHAFAVLLQLAAVDAQAVAQGIYPQLQPTTVAAAGLVDIPNQPNLGDSLACVYYLRTLKALIFAPNLDNQSRLDFYRTIANSVSDVRHRVALEAMQCLMDHERAWTLLVDAQRESRDADIFRRVVDGLRRCLDTATAGAGSAATPTATAGAGAAVTLGEVDWPLAHAACRVCRVVGQTLQKAISFEAMAARAAARTGGAAVGAANSSSSSSRGLSSKLGGGSSLAPARVNTAGTANNSSSSSAFFGTSSSTPSPRASGGLGGGGGGEKRGITGESTTGSDSPFSLLDLPPTPSPKRGGPGAMLREQSLLDMPASPVHVVSAAAAAEQSNTSAIRDLCRALWAHKLMDCNQQHVRSLALEAMFLLVPDPSLDDPALHELWQELQIKMEACPSTLPETSLAHLVTSLMARVDCSAASREAIIPIALAIAESFVRQVPTDGMGLGLVRAWMQCLQYGPQCREMVLESVHRTLDAPLPAPPAAAGTQHSSTSSSSSSAFHRAAAAAAAATTPERRGSADWLGSGSGSGFGAAVAAGAAGVDSTSGKPRRPSSGSLSTRRFSAGVNGNGSGSAGSSRPRSISGSLLRRASTAATGSTALSAPGTPTTTGALESHLSTASNATAATPAGGAQGSSSSAPSTPGRSQYSNAPQQQQQGSPYAGSRGAGTTAAAQQQQHQHQLQLHSEACSATRRLKRLALWFMGEYCCELVGAPPPRTHEVLTAPGAAPATSADTLLTLGLDMANSTTAAAAASATATGAGSSGSCAWECEPAAALARCGGASAAADSAVATPLQLHAVTGGLSGAAVSVLMRLRQASIFEDALTRHTAVAALCAVAVRLPDPARFDAYLQLRTLLECEYNPAAPHVRRKTASSSSSTSESEGGVELLGYVEAQLAAFDALDNSAAFGVSQMAKPVVAYLDAVYASEQSNDRSSIEHAKQTALLQQLRSIVDATFSAPVDS